MKNIHNESLVEGMLYSMQSGRIAARKRLEKIVASTMVHNWCMDKGPQPRRTRFRVSLTKLVIESLNQIQGVKVSLHSDDPNNEYKSKSRQKLSKTRPFKVTRVDQKMKIQASSNRELVQGAIGMEQHLGVAINSLVKFLVSINSIVDIDFVRNDE